jgi:hypothetical protein
MPNDTITTVCVKYQHRDGWHVFTSPDMPGLYIASKEPRAAYEDVPIAVKRLIELDFNCTCDVIRPEPFDSFAQTALGRVPGGDSPLLRDEALFVKGRRNDRTAGAVQS